MDPFLPHHRRVVPFLPLIRDPLQFFGDRVGPAVPPIPVSSTGQDPPRGPEPAESIGFDRTPPSRSNLGLQFGIGDDGLLSPSEFDLMLDGVEDVLGGGDPGDSLLLFDHGDEDFIDDIVEVDSGETPDLLGDDQKEVSTPKGDFGLHSVVQRYQPGVSNLMQMHQRQRCQMQRVLLPMSPQWTPATPGFCAVGPTVNSMTLTGPRRELQLLRQVVPSPTTTASSTTDSMSRGTVSPPIVVRSDIGRPPQRRFLPSMNMPPQRRPQMIAVPCVPCPPVPRCRPEPVVEDEGSILDDDDDILLPDDRGADPEDGFSLSSSRMRNLGFSSSDVGVRVVRENRLPPPAPFAIGTDPYPCLTHRLCPRPGVRPPAVPAPPVPVASTGSRMMAKLPITFPDFPCVPEVHSSMLRRYQGARSRNSAIVVFRVFRGLPILTLMGGNLLVLENCKTGANCLILRVPHADAKMNVFRPALGERPLESVLNLEVRFEVRQVAEISKRKGEWEFDKIAGFPLVRPTTSKGIPAKTFSPRCEVEFGVIQPDSRIKFGPVTLLSDYETSSAAPSNRCVRVKYCLSNFYPREKRNCIFAMSLKVRVLEGSSVELGMVQTTYYFKKDNFKSRSDRDGAACQLRRLAWVALPNDVSRSRPVRGPPPPLQLGHSRDGGGPVPATAPTRAPPVSPVQREAEPTETKLKKELDWSSAGFDFRPVREDRGRDVLVRALVALRRLLSRLAEVADAKEKRAAVAKRIGAHLVKKVLEKLKLTS